MNILELKELEYAASIIEDISLEYQSSYAKSAELILAYNLGLVHAININKIILNQKNNVFLNKQESIEFKKIISEYIELASEILKEF